MKSFVEKLRADLRWLGFSGEGQGPRPLEYPFLVILAVCHVITFVWVNTIGRLGRFL